MISTFIDHVLDINDNSDSKIAGVFTRCFEVILDVSNHYCNTIDMMLLNESIDDFCLKN